MIELTIVRSFLRLSFATRRRENFLFFSSLPAFSFWFFNVSLSKFPRLMNDETMHELLITLIMYAWIPSFFSSLSLFTCDRSHFLFHLYFLLLLSIHSFKWSKLQIFFNEWTRQDLTSIQRRLLSFLLFCLYVNVCLFHNLSSIWAHLNQTNLRFHFNFLRFHCFLH